MPHCPFAVYHIAEVANRGTAEDVYAPPSLAAEGFIHCSRWEQLSRVAVARFAGREDLIVLEIDLSRLDAPIRFEDLYESGERYPHIYGSVTPDAVIEELRVSWPVPQAPVFHRIGPSPAGRRPSPDARAPVATRLDVLCEDTERAAAYVHAGLRRFNDHASPHHRESRAAGAVKPLAVMLVDGRGGWAGGVTGTVHWGWLDVDDLWVCEAYRGRGHGRELLLELERQGAARGARRSMLSTFSFQARGMYEKLGYRVVGEMVDLPPGGAMYWMRKDGFG